MATIDTNMSLVMIDPNEPLELYDGTIIKGRLEWFLYALCCLDYGNLPTPLSRIEEWANALITNELPNMEPQSRAEEFFKAILTGDTSNLPTPQSRSEVLLDKLARGENDFTNVEKIQSRYEFLLAYLIKNGGGIGNIDYVLYKFQKEDETLYNTKERPVKSAILKGQTLVNQSTTSELTFENVWQGKNIEGNALQSGKKYFASFDLESDNSELTIQARNGNSFVYHIHKGFTKGKNVLSFILEQDANGLRFQVGSDFNVKISNIIILEYQDGMENWDIPYFEGMQSVKMPVLTTTGKNLFDEQVVNNRDINISTGEAMNTGNRTVSINFIPVKPNTAYSFTRPVAKGNVGFRYYSQNQSFIGSRAFTGSSNLLSVTFETPSDCYFLKFIDEATQ